MKTRKIPKDKNLRSTGLGYSIAERTGIYVVFNTNDEIVYVGGTSNSLERMKDFERYSSSYFAESGWVYRVCWSWWDFPRVKKEIPRAY
jgi:hypothetical protein